MCILIRGNTNRTNMFKPIRDENDGCQDRDRKQREDQDPLASTKQLHQRQLSTRIQPALGFSKHISQISQITENSMLQIQEEEKEKEQKVFI